MAKQLPRASAPTPCPPFVFFTQSALEAAIAQVRAKGGGYWFRLGVTGGGCSGFQYLVELTDRVSDADYLFEQDGLEVVVDKEHVQYVNGLRIDYKDSLLEKKFLFDNPNATGTCGCGISFSF